MEGLRVAQQQAQNCRLWLLSNNKTFKEKQTVENSIFAMEFCLSVEEKEGNENLFIKTDKTRPYMETL